MATGFITNDADSIFVEGNTVKLFLSGVDPAEQPPAVANAASQDNQKEEDQGCVRAIAVRNGIVGSRIFMRPAPCSTTSSLAGY